MNKGEYILFLNFIGLIILFFLLLTYPDFLADDKSKSQTPY